MWRKHNSSAPCSSYRRRSLLGRRHRSPRNCPSHPAAGHVQAGDDPLCETHGSVARAPVSAERQTVSEGLTCDPDSGGWTAGRLRRRRVLTCEPVRQRLRFRKVEDPFVDRTAGDRTHDAFLLYGAQSLDVLEVGDAAAGDDRNGENAPKPQSRPRSSVSIPSRPMSVWIIASTP